MNPIQYLYFRAKFHSDSVAIRRLGSVLTYAQLLVLVRRMACKLRQLGIRPNQVVVTCLIQQQTDWTMALALMHEGVVTCSNHGFAPVPEDLEADFIITEKVVPGSSHGKTLLVDEAWLKDLPAVPEDFGPLSYGSGASLFRLVLTSGTTGQSKVVGLSVGEFLSRCMDNTQPTPPGSKAVCLFGLSTMLGFMAAFNSLLWGVTYYHANYFKEVINLIDAFQIEYLSGSPNQLAGVIEELQWTSKRLTSLVMVCYGGGEVSPSLLDKMRRDLCPNVTCRYGSTEAGGVSMLLVHDPNCQRGMAGYVLPEAEVQIVDASHTALTFNEEGQIRIKTPSLVKGYYNNPRETSRSFKDGWFYPGDRGKFLKNGLLILLGRESELINRGGVKVDPMAIDRCIQDFPGVQDAAAFSFENHLGLVDICVAMVVQNEFDLKALQKHIIAALGIDRDPSVFMRIKEIPRNQMGKPLRKQLQDSFGEGLRQQSRPKGSSAGPNRV